MPRNYSLWRPLLLLFLLQRCTLLVWAQQEASPSSTLTINARLVAFDALVRNRNGELVHGLTRDDFLLTEDGRPQTIRYFTEDTDLPLDVGLMVDTSGSERAYFAAQRAASAAFLRNMLTGPEDKAFLVRFDDNTLLLQRLTGDVAALDGALGKLTVAYPARPGPRAGTLLFDAICGVAHNAFGSQLNRRAVIVLTDGEDNGSTKNRDEALACAQQANIAIYTALYTSRDPGPQEEDDPLVHVSPREHLMGRTVMERLSRATGGRVFVVEPHRTIEKIYAQIEEDLRSQYRIGYTPPRSAAGSYHELVLKPLDRHSKVSIQSRDGYYTP